MCVRQGIYDDGMRRKNKFTVRRVRKLSDASIRRMRSERRRKRSQKQVAKKYGVTQAFVSKVWARKSRTKKHRGRKDKPSK